MGIRGILGAVVRVAAVAAALLITSAPAAGAAVSGATVTPDHGAPGADITIAASGFKASTPVDVLIEGGKIASGTANASGDASVTFQYRNQGIFAVALQGIDPTGKALRKGTAVTFTNQDCIPPAGQTRCATLPRTGKGVLAIAALGGAALAVGALLVWHARTRHGFAVFAAVVVLIGGAVSLMSVRPSLAATSSTISGKVFASNGTTPLADICVQTYDTTNFAKAVTGADGAYTLSGLGSGNYVLGFVDCAASPTHTSEYFDSKSSPSAADKISLDGTTTAADKNASLLGGGGTISGVVTAASDGAPVAGACIFIGTSDDALNCIAQTGDAGSFLTASLASGSYIVAVLPTTNHAIRFNGNKEDAASSTKIDVTDGTNKEANISLLAAAKITGTVRDAAGSAVRQVCPADLTGTGVATLMSSFADTDGTYTLDHLGPGSHKVKFTDCDGNGTPYQTQFYQSKADANTADPVALTAGNTAPNIDACMSSSSATASNCVQSTDSTTTTAPTTTTTTAATTTTVASGGGSTTTTAAPSNAATVSSSTVAPGGALVVTGNGFQPGSSAGIFVFSTPVLIGTATADANGVITKQVAIPATLAAGAHTIQIQGIDPSGATRIVTAAITVAGGHLSVTGAETGSSAVAGALFVLLGSLLVRLGRRRDKYALL
jgi:hypothetical protein